MNFIKTKIEDVVIIEPKVFEDDRGYFFESYNQKVFIDNNINVNFVQDNNSKSKKGTLRGLHYQIAPMTQGKLVRVTKGEVFDVAVDIRKNSPTFGEWVGVYLSEENKKMFWVPPGFAHGFYVTSDEAEFTYKCTNFYSLKDDRSIRWDDPKINIEWPIQGNILLSEKDRNAKNLLEAELL